MSCCFRECTGPAVGTTMKCHYHRNRAKCRVMNCYNQVYARQLCVSHGGRRRCQYPECKSNARLGRYCTPHGKKMQASENIQLADSHEIVSLSNEFSLRKDREKGPSSVMIHDSDPWPYEINHIHKHTIDPLDYAILQTLLVDGSSM